MPSIKIIRWCNQLHPRDFSQVYLFFFLQEHLREIIQQHIFQRVFMFFIVIIIVGQLIRQNSNQKKIIHGFLLFFQLDINQIFSLNIISNYPTILKEFFLILHKILTRIGKEDHKLFQYSIRYSRRDQQRSINNI